MNAPVIAAEIAGRGVSAPARRFPSPADFPDSPLSRALRQPVLLADDRSLVSISPQLGFLHQTNELDTLGPDQPETACHFH